MELQESRKKEEIERAKAKFKDTRHMLEVTSSKLKKLETDFKEDKLQYSKELKNLQNIQATQNIRISKVSADLKNIENVLQSRKTEENSLLQASNEIREEMDKLKEETESMISKFQKSLMELEDSIEIGYVQLKNDKETEAMLELCLSSLKIEEQMPFLEEVFKSRKELIMKRQEELEKELEEIEEAQQRMAEKIKTKTNVLNMLKDKHSSLTGIYEMNKRMKQRH